MDQSRSRGILRDVHVRAGTLPRQAASPARRWAHIARPNIGLRDQLTAHLFRWTNAWSLTPAAVDRWSRRSPAGQEAGSRRPSRPTERINMCGLPRRGACRGKGTGAADDAVWACRVLPRMCSALRGAALWTLTAHVPWTPAAPAQRGGADLLHLERSLSVVTMKRSLSG